MKGKQQQIYPKGEDWAQGWTDECKEQYGTACRSQKDKQTQLTFLCHADPSGNVPAMIYNVAATNQGYSALRAKKALEQ